MSETDEQPGTDQHGAQQPSWVFTPLKIVAATAMFLMSALTFVDVLGRYLFASPIRGSFEIIGLLLGVIAFTGLPLVSVNQTHITVDLFDSFIRGRIRRVLAYVMALGTALMMAFISYRLMVAGIDEAANNFVTENLGISRAPLIYGMSALSLLTCVLLLRVCWRRQVKDTGDH
ncbi:MAG: TRAP transporter small permease [Methyloligellaceae bacterium]